MSKLDSRVREAAVNEAKALEIDVRMSYEEFLEETGRDDSFVGDLRSGIPSTHDVYVASQELHDAAPSPTPTF